MVKIFFLNFLSEQVNSFEISIVDKFPHPHPFPSCYFHCSVPGLGVGLWVYMQNLRGEGELPH